MDSGELGNCDIPLEKYMERHCCTPMKYAIKRGIIMYNGGTDTYTLEKVESGIKDIVIIFHCPICGKPLYKYETYR